MENNLEEHKKRDIEVFEADVKGVAEQLPDHRSKEFTFSKEEQQMLAEQQTIISLASQAQNRVINELVLHRIGVTPSNDVYVRYSIGLGRFVVFAPRPPKKK